MGSETSTVVDEGTSPSVLEARNIEAVAKYIKEKDVRRIVVMVCHLPRSPLLAPHVAANGGDGR
jgi:hypothetical protein